MANTAHASATMTRRQFLVVSSGATAGLLIGFRASAADAADTAGTLTPNAFVRVESDGTVTVICKHFEMGQGTTTGLATLVAEELDADWSTVRVEWAPADATRYNNLFWGPMQGTGGSTAIANSFEQYRKAGAVARDMLVRAAAARWEVAPDSCETRDGRVTHPPSGRSEGYGALAAEAARLAPPELVLLKSPEAFRLIGKQLPRKDSSDKCDGSAVFALDVRVPGMLRAVVARPPRFGGTVKSFDDTAARGVRGVVDVVQVPSGVAVLAENTWAAIKAREALSVEWDFTHAESRSTSTLRNEYNTLAGKPGTPARRDGDPDTALAGAAQVVYADFHFPFLAHAPMEPLNCVIAPAADGCDVWAGSQFPTVEQATVAAILGLEAPQVRIHTVYAGGSFGRRATPTADYVAEAAMVFKASGAARPVQLVWTREDDIKGGYYRPMYHHRIKAGLDKKGRPVAWKHTIVGQSIVADTPFAEFLVKDGVDKTSVEGVADMPYAVPHVHVDLHTTRAGVPILWWRSVGHTHTAFAVESFVDELAHAAQADPVEYRLALLEGHPRWAGVLRLAAERAGWGKPLAAGRGRGVAVHASFSSFVAEVAEVSVAADGAVKVDRVVCAVDCGLAVNPDVIRAQMEGGIGFGLGAVMRNAITLRDGEVEQSNFPDYLPLRIGDMPPVEVHIVPSAESPTGVGEPGVPPIGPALANAIFAATGKRPRVLPMTESGIRFA